MREVALPPFALAHSGAAGTEIEAEAWGQVPRLDVYSTRAYLLIWDGKLADDANQGPSRAQIDFIQIGESSY